jgi:two-component system response regulator AtoC
MTSDATFPLPDATAPELRDLFADPRRVASGLDAASLARALDMAQAVSGAARVGLRLVGAEEAAGALGLPADVTAGEQQLAGEAVWVEPLRAPLLPEGGGPTRAFGALALAPPPGAERAARTSRHVATALLRDALERARGVDPLTGLLTRAQFDRARGALSGRLSRGEEIAVALLDIDGLRRRNASGGPQAGDAVLSGLAAGAMEALGPDGRAYRHGGDELLLELTGDEEAVAAVVARLQQLLGGLRGEPALTLTAGIACAPPAGDADELVSRADHALSEAKRRGAGQVCRWSPQVPPSPARDPLRGVLTGRDERDVRNVEALLEAVQAVTQLAPLEETLVALVDRCVEVTGAERGLLLERDGEGWRVCVARDRAGQGMRDPGFAASVADEARAEGRAVHHVLEEEVGEAISPSAAALELRAVLCAPLAGEDVPEGVVYVDSREASRFDPATLAFFGALVAQLTTALRNAALYDRLRDRHRRLRDDLAGRDQELTQVRSLLSDRRLGDGSRAPVYADLLGRSPAMQKVFDALAQLEGVAVPVVIEGESGTGKELIARAIHDRSPRGHGPWVAVNAAAIPEALFESELFGHVRGAFTGAQSDRVGLIEEADGGTLFLDEVAELPLDAQAKLLRVLQEGEVRRVGDARPRPVDVRVVAASNRSLRAMVAEGSFREDLYYRLAVFRLLVPPLRDRVGDLPLLCEHLLGQATDRGVPAAELSAEALRALSRRSWPGNVRQLRNALGRAATLAGGGTIGPEHVSEDDEPQPLGLEAGALDLPLREARQLFCLHYARRRVEEANGSIAAASRAAGVSRQTLYRTLAEGEELERRLAGD